MYAQIVVLTYQSADLDSYTYEISKDLENEVRPGQIVQVPFGNRNPMGLVIAISHSPSAISPKPLASHSPESENQILNQVQGDKIKIKPISKILLQHPLLLPYQIKLLKWMSFYYMAPMVNCLKVILPDVPSIALNKATYSSSEAQAESRSFKNEKFSINSNNKNKIINQTLVLVPTINKIPETLAKFPKARNYAVYHNELKNSEKFATWIKILSGQVDYVFGSRSAIFIPCPKLSEIIIFDEHDKAYKDERSPYFDTLTVAQKISELTGCKLQIFDSSPKITTYYLIKNPTMSLRATRSNLNPVVILNESEESQILKKIDSSVKPQNDKEFSLTVPRIKARSKIVPMQDERAMGNKSPISSLLEEYLIYAAKKNKNVLLFLNKKKGSGSLFCKNCKYNDYFEKQPEFCPKCKSADVYFNVLNINSLKKEISKLTQHSIDIATALIFYSPIVMKFDLVAYIQPDPLLTRADFSSVESLYAQITNLKKLLKKDGILVIQTYSVNDETLKAAAYSNYPLFFKDQLEKRRLLFYPPFALLIKLVIKGKNEDKVAKLAHQLFSRLNSTIQQFNNSTISLLGPFKPVFFSKKPTFNIIIKYKIKDYDLKSREEAIKNLSSILKGLNKKAQIVVEPASIN